MQNTAELETCGFLIKNCLHFSVLCILKMHKKTGKASVETNKYITIPTRYQCGVMVRVIGQAMES